MFLGSIPGSLKRGLGNVKNVFVVVVIVLSRSEKREARRAS